MPGDTVQEWTDRTTPARTVASVTVASRVLVRWTDGTQGVFRRWAVFHKSKMALRPRCVRAPMSRWLGWLSPASGPGRRPGREGADDRGPSLAAWWERRLIGSRDLASLRRGRSAEVPPEHGRVRGSNRKRDRGSVVGSAQPIRSRHTGSFMMPSVEEQVRQLADEVVGPIETGYLRPWMCTGDPTRGERLHCRRKRRHQRHQTSWHGTSTSTL